ncbi:hypothetical protein NKJ74_31350 [Mesorhizobium sp. M0046]|uniref:hypothetical protein n=1 Tax=Mesorhizobium sp. M0046 TaxID=2956858 RepID=UPI00333BAD36
MRSGIAMGPQRLRTPPDLGGVHCGDGVSRKSAIRVLNSHPEPKHRQTRQRLSLYDEAARGALIVLWEASDRVYGKRLKALLPILLPRWNAMDI